MPELPEVEVLVRHLSPLLRGRTIHAVTVRREKVIRPTSARRLRDALRGARFVDVRRRGKYLVFTLRSPGRRASFLLLGHLGMTGRIFLAPRQRPWPKHTAVALDLGSDFLVYDDTRYFGRFTLDTEPLNDLGTEPLEAGFTVESLAAGLRKSKQAIKVNLLDQRLMAGLGNIYASEALYRAGIAPRRPACRLKPEEVKKLHRAIRFVLSEAIRFGSTVPLSFAGNGGDSLFYYGREPESPDYYEERLRVYDREGQLCQRCGGVIRRVVQAARSTYFCPGCQR